MALQDKVTCVNLKLLKFLIPQTFQKDTFLLLKLENILFD